MSFSYKIGEIAALLSVSRETLRFYEKRGLLRPEKSPQNSYRSYSLSDLYRLADIIFYRQLDLSLDDIHYMLTNADLEAIMTILSEKQTALTQKIAQEKLQLKKLEAISQQIQQIPELLGQYRCVSFPPSYILLDNQPANDTLLNSFAITSQQRLEMSESLRLLSYDGKHWHSNDEWIVILRCQWAEESGLADAMTMLPIFSFEHCWQTIVCLKSEQELLSDAAESFAASLAQQGTALAATMYSNYLCSSTEGGELIDYYFLYAPEII